MVKRLAQCVREYKLPTILTLLFIAGEAVIEAIIPFITAGMVNDMQAGEDISVIIRKGLRRCVVGTVDPFAEVQGRGIQKLRDAGIEVTVGVCEDECRELNKRFFTFHQQHRPFITLKWAQTSDGYIGLPPTPSERGGEGRELKVKND